MGKDKRGNWEYFKAAHRNIGRNNTSNTAELKHLGLKQTVSWWYLLS